MDTSIGLPDTRQSSIPMPIVNSGWLPLFPALLFILWGAAQYLWKRSDDKKKEGELAAAAARAARRRQRARRARALRRKQDRRLTALEREVAEQAKTNVRQDEALKGIGTQLSDISQAVHEVHAAVLNRHPAPGGE